MTTLVFGANGATGRLVVEQLLKRGGKVKAIVRQTNSLPNTVKNHANLSEIQASVSDLKDTEIAAHMAGCEAVVCCLGHNLTFRGIYGHPRLLVTDTTRRVCEAIKKNNPTQAVRLVLMNTTGNSNRDIPERIPFSQACVIWLVRLLLPPHRDNEKAADYLRTQIGQSSEVIEWTVVRPDSLVNEDEPGSYELHASPTRNPIFDAGPTSRINVAHFMAELLTDSQLWNRWKGQMPVIYNNA